MSGRPWSPTSSTWPPPPPTPKNEMAEAMSEMMKYFSRWWDASTAAAPASDQPQPMTYEEVMSCAPRRRIYSDALDDASSSGDEGEDDDLETSQRDGNIDKVLKLHQGLREANDDDDGVEESKETSSIDDDRAKSFMHNVVFDVRTAHDPAAGNDVVQEK